MKRLASYAAAVLVAAAVGVGVPVAPAQAGTCPDADGVTVIVDFNSLGGGVQGTCQTDGGGQTASTLFGAAGFPLTYAQRQPGFVCRVSGVPTSDPCVNTSPANAYWGLWWSDGKNGRWTYSTLGATSLTIPDGGYVAFSFDDVDGAAPPSATPTAHTAQSPPPPPPPSTSTTPPATPTAEPDPGGATGGPGGRVGSATPSGPGSPGEPGPTGTADPTATSPASAAPSEPPGGITTPSPGGTSGVSPSDSASPSASAMPGEPGEPGAEVQDPVAPTADSGEGDGLPVWVAPGLIAVLFLAAGAAVLLRRRTPGS